MTIATIPNNGMGLTVQELEQALDAIMREADRIAKLLEERRQALSRCDNKPGGLLLQSRAS